MNELKTGTKRLIFCCVFIATLFVLPATALEKVTFQLDWLPGGDKAPVYVGIGEGIFEKYGIEVTISGGKGSTDALTKMATGRSDIGTSGMGALMSAKAQQNIPVSAVMPIFTKSPHAFITYENSGINSIKDLPGKVIATSPFTSSNVFLPMILKDNQISEKDFKILYVDAGALGPLLATGKAHAVIAWLTDPYRYAVQLEKSKKQVKVIPWSDTGFDLYGISLVAGERFLKERPHVANKFLAAYIEAVRFTHSHPKKASEYVTKMVREISPESAYQSVLAFNSLSDNDVSKRDGLGNFSSERLLHTWSLVAESQDLDIKTLNLETLVAKLP